LKPLRRHIVFLTKREERQRCEFEALQADWYADNGNAPQKPGEQPTQSQNKSAEHKP